MERQIHSNSKKPPKFIKQKYPITNTKSKKKLNTDNAAILANYQRNISTLNEISDSLNIEINSINKEFSEIKNIIIEISELRSINNDNLEYYLNYIKDKINLIKIYIYKYYKKYLLLKNFKEEKIGETVKSSIPLFAVKTKNGIKKEVSLSNIINKNSLKSKVLYYNWKEYRLEIETYVKRLSKINFFNKLLLIVIEYITVLLNKLKYKNENIIKIIKKFFSIKNINNENINNEKLTYNQNNIINYSIINNNNFTKLLNNSENIRKFKEKIKQLDIKFETELNDAIFNILHKIQNKPDSKDNSIKKRSTFLNKISKHITKKTELNTHKEIWKNLTTKINNILKLKTKIDVDIKSLSFTGSFTKNRYMNDYNDYLESFYEKYGKILYNIDKYNTLYNHNEIIKLIKHEIEHRNILNNNKLLSTENKIKKRDLYLEINSKKALLNKSFLKSFLKSLNKSHILYFIKLYEKLIKQIFVNKRTINYQDLINLYKIIIFFNNLDIKRNETNKIYKSYIDILTKLNKYFNSLFIKYTSNIQEKIETLTLSNIDSVLDELNELKNGFGFKLELEKSTNNINISKIIITLESIIKRLNEKVEELMKLANKEKKEKFMKNRKELLNKKLKKSYIPLNKCLNKIKTKLEKRTELNEILNTINNIPNSNIPRNLKEYASIIKHNRKTSVNRLLSTIENTKNIVKSHLGISENEIFTNNNNYQTIQGIGVGIINNNNVNNNNENNNNENNNNENNNNEINSNNENNMPKLESALPKNVNTINRKTM